VKIDLSTIFLVIVCIIPGLFALRGRNSVCPKSFESQGASSELGELVAFGIMTHGLLILFAGILMVLAGLVRYASPLSYYWKLDSWPAALWVQHHPTEACTNATLYIFLSFVLSHCLGVLNGIWRQKQFSLTTRLLAKSILLKRLGVTGLLGERPIIYEALNPQIDDLGKPALVFVELEMKGSLGYYSGQLSKFAIVRDEEPHKLVYMINVVFRKLPNESYVPVPGEGMMIDLADVLTMQVKQVFPDDTGSSSQVTSTSA